MSAILLMIAAFVLIVGAIFIYRYSTRQGGPRFGAVAREYRTVLYCFAVLFLTLFLVGLAAWYATPANESYSKAILQGITGSLAEDLAFFSLLGFILILAQRRETDLNRNLDDKIELLFSAKKLRSGEAAFLRNEIRKISADCRTVSVDIDVIDEDLDNQLIRIDVSRSWLVANYLSSESAEYTWRLRLVGDDAAHHYPALSVFPSYTSEMTADENGQWQTAQDREVLHAGGEAGNNGEVSSETQVLEIKPRHAREFRTRFQGWQQLYAKPQGLAANFVGPIKPEPDPYRLKLEKHWDEIEITLRNSLKRSIMIIISASGERKMQLDPGERKVRAYRGENLAANSHVYVSFILI